MACCASCWSRAGFACSGAGVSMIEFTFWDIVRNLLLAARWTVLLSLAAFIGGGIVGLVCCSADRQERWSRASPRGYIELFQGTPLLMQLFLMPSSACLCSG
jgi:polar amino acid transport system permease protein